MPIISESKDYVVFTGGLGVGSGTPNPGGCTKEFWGNIHDPDKDLPDVMDVNGSTLSDANARALPFSSDIIQGADYGGGNVVRVTKSGQGWFEDCVPGLIAYVSFTSVYVTDRYEVLGYDSVSYDWIDIDLAYVSDTTGACGVGGAFPGLQQAVDNTDANGTSPHNVFITCNVDRVFTSPTHELDLDSGGDLATGTWKRIIGTDNHGLPLNKYNFRLVDVDNEVGISGFLFGDADNISVEHFHVENAPLYGFEFGGVSDHYNFRLVECKVTNCTICVYSNTATKHNIQIIGGYYYAQSDEVFWVNTDQFSMIGTYAVVAGSDPVVRLTMDGAALISGCIIKGGSTAPGINTYGTGILTIEDSVFYYTTNCVSLLSNTASLVEYGNIFFLPNIGDRAINQSSGTILYSNYSCIWTISGAPTDADRWGNEQVVPFNALEVDPEFVNAGNSDFRLKGTSPVIRMSRPTLGLLSY